MSTETEKDSAQPQSERSTKYIFLNKSTVHNSTSIADISQKLLCIEYPGIVDSVDTMIESLGGMHNVEMAVGNYNRRLELKFRPNDIFCKPCWGDKDFKTSLLVKITVHKSVNSGPSSSKSFDVNETTYSYKPVGVIPMTFKFNRLCDFQYLPLVPQLGETETAESTCCNIYEKIIPSKVPDLKWFESEESKTMPFFFPPPVFAKFNTSKDNKLYYERYKYYEKVLPEFAQRLKKEADNKKQEPKNLIGGRSRTFRKANSIFVNVNAKNMNIPEGPTEDALDTIRKRGLLCDSGPMVTIKKLFEERPIWSKSALLHKSGIRSDRLKVILPGVAYYCPTGPWRIMWCKFGYNPTLDPNSRIYQTFDFRIRASGGLKVKVQAKRSYSSNILQYKAGPITTSKFSLKDCSSENVVVKRTVDENFYILKPGVLPPARQMFYQYCDLELPEIKDMIARLPQITSDMKYDRKNGWLPNGFHEHCREISNSYVTDYVKKLLVDEKKKMDMEKERDINFGSQNKPTQSNKPDVTILGATIVIDDDEDGEEGNTRKPDGTDSEDEQMDFDGDELDGDIIDSDEADDANDELGEVIDMKAVEEINEIIGSMDDPEAQVQSGSGDKDSEDEFDPELIKLYRKLILSNVDGSS
uniref:Transcription factor IIIC subunit 5 HTH domain-containing protein n=1 Tax=Photinus pyralis TaxID=7054 RepID=A0A1Y1NEZ5_PHOPY